MRKSLQNYKSPGKDAAARQTTVSLFASLVSPSTRSCPFLKLKVSQCYYITVENSAVEMGYRYGRKEVIGGARSRQEERKEMMNDDVICERNTEYRTELVPVDQKASRIIGYRIRWVTVATRVR